jgi:hypothetical protein
MTSDKTANRGEKRQIYPTYRKMTTEEWPITKERTALSYQWGLSNRLLAKMWRKKNCQKKVDPFLSFINNTISFSGCNVGPHGT